jgi:PleD family two-component response regulator
MDPLVNNEDDDLSLTSIRASSRHKILVVDDMPMYILVAQTILRSNYEVSTAKSAEEALKILDSTFVDLALLDIDMPHISGLELFQKMLENPDLRTIPVVFVTSEKDGDTVQTALKLGAKDYIVKPYVGSLLLAKIYRVLKGASDDQSVVFLEQRIKKVIDYCQKNEFGAAEDIVHVFPRDVYNAFVSLNLRRILSALHNQDISQVVGVCKEILRAVQKV